MLYGGGHWGLRCCSVFYVVLNNCHSISWLIRVYLLKAGTFVKPVNL